MTIGILLLRLVLGVVFLGHGTQKLFGWWNGGGPAGTAAMVDRAGFRPPGPFAILGGLTETIGGMFVLLGFLTPLGAAAVIGVMAAAAVAVHLRNGMWNTNGGIEFPLVNAAAATAIAFIGPGRVSIDRALGWHLRGLSWGLFSILLGLGAGIVVLGWRGVQLRRERPGGEEWRQPPWAA